MQPMVEFLVSHVMQDFTARSMVQSTRLIALTDILQAVLATRNAQNAVLAITALSLWKHNAILGSTAMQVLLPARNVQVAMSALVEGALYQNVG